MDGSLSLNPVVELRNSFESLPALVRRPIEVVVFGGELPRADISGMRRMAAEFRAQAAALSDRSEDTKELLAQEDSVGILGERLRETLGLHRDGSARLGDDALALADQVQAAANDAEKTLCVMFVFGIELAWRIFGVLSAAAAAGPAGEVAAVPVAESMLIEGRASVAAMRAGLDQAFRAGATRTAARLSALGALQLPVTLAKAAALPVGVDAGVQALQAASGDRTLAVIGSDGENPTGIDLTSIKVAALAGAGGALGGMVAGRVAPKVFPRIEGSRLALGLVHGTAGAVAGLGAAALVTGWPDHFDHVLAPLLNGGFAGVVHAHALARPGSAAPTGAMIDGGGAFTRPDLPAAIRGEDAAALPPVEVSAESKQAWEAAKAAWAATPDPVTAAGARAEVPAAGVHENTAPVKSGESRSPAVSSSMPHKEATGRPQVELGSAGRSETGAPVGGPQRGEPGARTNATAPRPIEPGAETSAPQKVSTSTPTRQVGSGLETPAAAEHRSPGNHEQGNTGKDETHHQTPVDARPATGTGDAETLAAGESRLPGNEEHALTAERSVLAGETGDEVSAGPAADPVDSAGSPAPSARDHAVELLADFHAGSGDRIPEQLRLCNLPDEVLQAGLFDTDARKSMIATTEILRRGTISDAVPGGMVLRVEQAEGLYALDQRPVEMKPGEGKSLMFMAAAMQRAVRHGECLLVTTTDGLAHREFTRYRQLLTEFGIDVFRADQQTGFGPVTAGRPAVVVATGETVGHLCNAGHRPPRHALIDEMDGIIDRGERQFLRSEGVEQAAPEATAREVFAAHDFLTDALEKGTLSHEDFGLTRIIEEVGLHPDGTPEIEFWYDGRAELTPGGRDKVEALPGGKQWLEGLGLSRLETAAAAEFTCRKSTHYVMDAGKIVIIDQGEHGLQRNPKTSSESRWSAEQGKASLAQAVEAKEIRAAEAIRMSAEQHQIVVRADADSAKNINAVEIYRTGGRPQDRFFDEVTGASGTLADLNPVLEKIYGLEEAHQVDRAREQRLMEGAPEVVANTRAKLSAIAEGAHRVWQGGRGRSQEILCHRNDLVDRQVQALVRQGVPREAIEAVDADRIAGWGAGWEGQLQKIFDAAGEQGKILVINRQGQRGVDIAVSEAVQAKGGMFVWMTEVPEQSYIHEQAKNRTARNGDRGAAQALISPQDALIRKAMHLDGVRAAAVRYEQVAEAHRTDPTPENHNNLVEASDNLRSLVPELQERALRHATADFIRHHAYLTDNPAAVLAAAETFRYQGSTEIGQVGQPDYSPDPATRLAGLLGIPAAAVAALEQDGADDPLGSLLERTGLPPAAVEALRQQVETTAPGTVEQYAGLTDEQALDQLVPQRDRLAGKLGWDTEAIEGAEGMRTIDPALTEARDNLAKTLGYPVSDITPAIARDILGEAVNHHLSIEGTPESATSDETSPIPANPVSVDRVAENPVAEDAIAAASHYLATAALLDLVVQIHRRSPNSCVNNAVTGMRVLSGRNIEMPSSTLTGHGRDAVENVFGAPLANAGSLDGVVESLRARPGGITVLVYKWKDAPAKGSTNAKATGIADADDHMVLVVNDSEPGEAPKLVVVDLAASRDGDSGTDYGPKDLRDRRTLLDKAVPFDTWRQEQHKFIGKLPADKRRFETIEFDVEGNLVARSHRDAPAAETPRRSQEAEVSAELVQEINSIPPGWPVNGDGTPDLPSGTDADTSDKSDISRSAEPARIGSRPHDTPDPAEPALETGQEHEASAAPEALHLALAVVDSFRSSPEITRDAQRFVTKCYKEYRQQEEAALQEQRWTALVNELGMTSEEADQASKEYVRSAEVRGTVDDAAARSAAALVSDMAHYADRVQVSLPGTLADLYLAEANTANARKLQHAFALIDRVESSPDTARDAKRFVMSCYAEYRQKQEAAFQRQRRTAVAGLTPEAAEQQAREFVDRADIRAAIDSAAATDTRQLIHNIQGKWTRTSLPLPDTLARLHQAEATTASARKLAKSMTADTGDAQAPDDRVGSRPHENIGDSTPAADALGDHRGLWHEFAVAIPNLITADAGRWAAQGNSPDFRWLASQLGPLARYFSSVGDVALRLVGDEPFAELLPLWRRVVELGAEFENEGFGIWHARTMYQLMEWLVDYAPVGEYRNSYEVVDSVNDRGVYVGISNEVNRAGIARYTIVAAEGTPRGGEMFADGWDEVGDIVHGIEGFWIQNNKMLGDNLATFNAGIREKLSPEDAARATFTGKMAYRRGFTEVLIDHVVGDPGYYERAVVTFVRPSRLWEMRCRLGARLMGISLPELLDRAGWSSEIAYLRDEAALESAEIDRQASGPSTAEKPADWSSRRTQVERKIAKIERLATWVRQWWAEQDARDHSAIATVAADVVRRNPSARQVTPNTVLLPGHTVVVIAEDGLHDDAMTDMLLHNLELRSELRGTGYTIRQLKPVVEQDDSGNSRVRSESLGTVHVDAKRRMPDDRDLARRRRDERVRSEFRSVITDGANRDTSSAAFLRTDWPRRAALVRQRHDLTSQLRGIPARWRDRACRYRHAQEVARLRDSWENIDEAEQRRLAYLETIDTALARADAGLRRIPGQHEVYLWAFDPDTGYLVLTLGDPDLVPDIDDIGKHIIDTDTTDLLEEVDRAVEEFARNRLAAPGHRRAVVITVSRETDSDAEQRRLADLADITATRAFYHDRVVDSAADGNALVRLLEGDRRDAVSEMLWLVKYLIPDHPVHVVATAGPDFPVGAPGEEFAARVGADWSAVFDRPEDVATHLAHRPGAFALLAVENPARDYGGGVDLVLVRNDGDDRLVQIDLNHVNPHSVEPGAAARSALTRDWPPFDPSGWVGKWDKGFGIGLGPDGPERPLVDGESTGVRGEDFPDGLIGSRPTEEVSGSAYERYRHHTRQYHGVAGNWLSAMFGEPLSTALQPDSSVLLDWATRQVVDRHRLAELLRLLPDELAADSRRRRVWAQLNQHRMLRNPTERDLYVDELMGWTSIGDAHLHPPGVVHSAAERFVVSRGVLESADRIALLAWRLGCFDELAGQLRADEQRSAALGRDEPAGHTARVRRALADRLESLTAELEVHEDALDAIDTAGLQKACNFHGLVWFDLRPGSTSRTRLDSLLDVATAELGAAVGRDPAQLGEQEQDDYRNFSEDWNTRRLATTCGELTMVARVTDQAHHHETRLAALTEQLDNELAQVFGPPPDSLIQYGPSGEDVVERLGQRFPGVRSPAADVLARHVDATGVERFLMVEEIFRDGGRGVWRLPSALEAVELDVHAAGPLMITEADLVVVGATARTVAGVDGRRIRDARWLTRGEIERRAAERMVHGGFQENFSSALDAFDPVVTPTDAAGELARLASRLSLSTDDIELLTRRLTRRPADEHTRIVHFFHLLADEFERNKIQAEINVGGGDFLDMYLHRQQTQHRLAADPEIVDVISTPMAHSILLDMANSNHWSGDTIGAGVEFLASPEIADALRKIGEKNSHFEHYVCRRMSNQIAADLDAFGRELCRVAEIPAGAVDLRLLTMFDGFATKNPPGKDRVAWDVLVSIDDFSPGSVHRKFADAFLRTRQIAGIPDDVRAEVAFTAQQLRDVEDLYIRGPSGREFACYVETVGELPVGQRPPTIRAAMEFVRDVTPEFARWLRTVLADGASAAERSALGLQRSGEAVVGELKDVARAFVAEVKDAGLSAESLAKVQSSDFLAQLLIDVTRYDKSDEGDIASLRELLREHERATAEGGIAPMPEEYRPSGVVEVAKLRTRDGASGPQWTEDLLTRFARLAQNLQTAHSAMTLARRPITHLLDELGRGIAEHIGTLEHSLASGRLGNGLPMNDVARRNMTAHVQDLKELIAPKAEHATQFPALRSLADFENNFQRLARVGELHDDLRAICFAWAMQRHPEWVDRLQHIGAGEPTLEDIVLVREFVDHITNQEVFAQYFAHRQGARTFRRMTSVAALDEAIARTQGVGVSSDTTPLRFVPTRGPLLELSGHIANACWAGKSHSVAEAMPNMTAVIMVRNPDDPARTALVGAGLLIETTSASGEPLLLIRGLNPLETYINHVSVADFYRKFTDWAHGIAASRGRRLAIVIDDHCGGAATNRLALYSYLAEVRPELTPIRVDPSDTTFNGYDVTECTYLAGSTGTPDQQQHREPGGLIGSRPSENPGGRFGWWLRERGLRGDAASADWSADDLLSQASGPLPAEVIGREIDEVTEILGARVPPEQLTDPEIRRGMRLVAEGLWGSRSLYGGPDTGRADDIYDAARYDAAGELREPGAANRHGDRMRIAEDLRHILDNGLLQDADLAEIMTAMIANAWSDLADGGGRHGGNPRRQDTARSAELLYARAMAHGCAASTARMLGFAVTGIGFDARTGTQMIASTTAVAEMRQRWGELTGGEFETAMRVARWVAAADLRTLSEPDAVVQWVRSDRDGAGVGMPERQVLIDRLRDRAGFADPDTGYRPPDGWLLANRDMRRDHAAKAREIADRLASEPGYTPLDAYRDSRLHTAEMREEHSGFRWQLVIGPGADTSDPGALADAVAALLPESGDARAREDIIDAMARLAELTLPHAGADAVFVVTSAKDADGRRCLLAELDYTRPDETDPAPGMTAEELRHELSDVDGRIDIDTADTLPEGQVRHRVRLDLTRQRILVCCRVWGSGGTGLSTLNVALCQALAAAGHEVIVSAGEIAPGSRLPGVQVYGDSDRVSAVNRRNGYAGGPDDLPQSVDLVIVHAEDGGLGAAAAAETRYPAARLVSVHHLTPMLWHNLRNSPERGRAEIAARIYLARRAHLVTGLGPVLARDALSAAVMAGHGSVHELQPGLEIAEQPPEPAPGDPAWILLFGRVDDQLKGAAETAEVVRRLRAHGRDVRLVLRGYPKRGVEAAHATLARLVGDPDAVEVRPYTSSRVKLRNDIRAATVVVMPSRAEGFGGVATEAIEQGVPVAVPSSSGVGRFLAELADYRDSAQRFNLVEQPLGASVPIDNWVAALGSVLDDLPGAWAAARGLQGLMRPYTRENSARMLVHAARNTDPRSRPEIRPSRTQVSLERGRLVARGEEEDYLRILAVADAMESDPAVRKAIISGTRIEFAPSRDPLTTGTASADDRGAGARSRAGDEERFDNRPATGRNSGPGGLIGSRPFEDTSGERASAGPRFEELVLAGLKSGIAERFVVEDARGVRVEEVRFDDGLRVFMETYADPLKALEQVLRTEVAVIMDAPVAHAILNLEDDRIYRKIPLGQPGDSIEVVDPELLGSESGLRLGLFDAVTGTHRAAREWSVADNEVMGGRSGSDVDASQTSVFASLFVRRINGRPVWLDHAMPASEVAAIREQVSHLDTLISNFPMPEKHRTALLDIHGGYLAALAQVERHAVHTVGERAHRAGLDAQAQVKARLVEVFTLNYPHVTVVGFDHPDVPADVVEEILGGLDEMFTRFPDRTNIRELRIEYTDWEANTPRTHNYADPAAAGRTLSMRFSLRDAANPAQTVKRGIRFLEFGLNPVGDRPFHHNAVHGFVHAIDAVEGLSKNLQRMLSQIWGQLSNHGLIEESWWTWLTRLPRYAFVNEAKTVLDDVEALAVGFAEADLHGVAVGSPAWAIHEYVTTGRLPRVTPDLEVDPPPQEDDPDSGGPSGLIGSRPHEDDSRSDAARGAWIEALRLERGMTRKQLTQAAGLPNSALPAIESGQRKPRIGSFQRICRALGLDDDALNDAVRQFYSDVPLDTGVAAHRSPGDWVRAARTSKGMTQSVLAHAVGVDPVRIRVYENNRERLRPGLFLRIARVLGVEQQALAEAVRECYRDIEFDLDPAAHDPGLPGSWIAALRYDQDMSRAELDRIAGIPETSVSRIEGGHTPNSFVFWRICRALEVAPEVLAAAARHFYRDLDLDLDPAAHDPASPGSWFVALRHDRDISQSEVAKAIGSGAGHLHRIESGRNRPRFAVFRRICDVLGVDDELLRAAVRHFYSDIDLDIEPAAHDPGLPGSWIAALRNDAGMSGGELARRARMPRDSIYRIENHRFRPRLRKFRQLCGVLGVGGEVLLEAVERFYAGRFERSGDRDEEDLFNRYVVSRVGSPEEREIRDEICARFAWVPNALARRQPPEIRDEAVQAGWMGILSAIDTHVPFTSFAAHAWASGSRAILRYRVARGLPDLDSRTLRKVITVRAQIRRMISAGEALDDTEIARATRLKMADVVLAREILARPTVQLDAPITGKDGSRNPELADPAALTGFSDTDFVATVRAALADMPDPGTAERLVTLHLVEGVPLAGAAERLGLQAADAAEVLADSVARLRNAFGSDRPGEVTARERGPATLTPGAEVAEQDQLPVRSSDPEVGDGGPGGLIGSRPFEDSPGERAFAGPGFQELVLAGLESGIAERFVVEEAPGLRVEEVTFCNGLRVFAERYSDPIKADIQVLQAEVAAVMGAPVAHAMLNLEDDRVYRELTPHGRPGHSFDILPPEVLDSSRAVLLGLFDAVTSTNRTGREWSMGPNDDVMGGRAQSDVDATPAGVFAARFVQRIDGHEVWLDNAVPRWAVEDIREKVTYVESWIESYPAPEKHRDVLLDIHRGYLAALAQIERHAVPTPWEMLHRAGLDDEWRRDDVAAKARLVEVFNLKYPYLTMVGFDHPHVRAHVIEEILRGLDEMFTRFPGRTDIRELRIDYLGDTKASARTSRHVDRVAAAGRTERIHFSLHHAARPAPFLELGIRSLADGINPIGDRPFHHDAVHEFIHAIDAKEGLSDNLRQVLGQTYSQLSRLGLVDEHWWTWFARLPRYAFDNEAKTVFNDEEALAVGFAEADIHGVAVGSPQWAIHEYVTTERPPRVTPDLEVDLPPQNDPPASGRPHGLIGSRPREDDSQPDAPRGSADVIASEQGPVSLTPWTTPKAEPDRPPARSGDSETGQGSPKPGGLIGSRPHEQDEPPRRPVPGQTTPWSREAIDEPHPDDRLREQPAHPIPERPADDTSSPVPLTACETEVLTRVRLGMTHNEIAAALDLSVPEVRAHLATVRRKLRNQRAGLVAPNRPAGSPSTTTEPDRFRAAMYAALTGADQPDPRELLARVSPRQMERAAQGLSSTQRAALHELRAGANTPVIRSMALIAARRWVTAVAAEHHRSQAVLATALAAANPADLQTALDQLTAVERQLLVDRFGPATSPATFEPDDSVRALRAVDIVRHVAGRIATRAGISAVDENDFDKTGHDLVENERAAAAQHANSAAAQTYTADECLDAVLDWMGRQAPGGPIAPGGPLPATASSEEPGRPDDNNRTRSGHADADDHWRSLPVDHDFDDEQRQLADEALRAGGFDDADRLQRWGYLLSARSAQRRATENGEWWNSLSDPADPGGLSSTQRALIQVYPHQIGNADGLPAVIRDHANRLSIRRELDEFIARKPDNVGMLYWIRTGLTAAERKQLSNLIHIRNHLRQLDRQAAAMPGSPPVHLLCYDSKAFHGKGKVVAALGNVDTAHTVNWHVPGTNTTSASLAYQFKPLRNLYEETRRVDPSLELASIIWIGYDAPAGPVKTGYAKAAFRRRARLGGRRLLCDIAAFHATRTLAGTASPDQLVNRLYGHSFGASTICHAGCNGALAGLVRTVTLSGAPGGGPLSHAAEFGIGADNVYVAASWRDVVTMFGADEPGAWSRFNPWLGHGVDPAAEAFGAKRIAAEFPNSPDFAGVEAVHQGYLLRDPATGRPTEALANVAQITAGRGGTLASVDRRRSGRGVVARPVDAERGQYADGNGNRDFDRRAHRKRAGRVPRDRSPKATPWSQHPDRPASDR